MTRQRLVDLCRRTYLDVASRHQEGFLQAVAREGWPPEGLLRQTQVFDFFVEAELRQGRRVALVLADALRFEMGRDLADRLGRRGKVRVEAAAASLPTTTPCEMASLMPGADATLRLEIDKDKLSPQVGGRRVSTSAERMDLLRSLYGDRMSEWTTAKFLGRKFSTLSQERLKLENRSLMPGDLRVRLEVRLVLEKGKVGPVVGQAADYSGRSMPRRAAREARNSLG